MARQKWIWLVSIRTQVWSLASLSGLRIWHCCELLVSCRHSSDPVLLWLWLWPAAAAPMGPLAWETLPATGVALKRQKKKKKKKNWLTLVHYGFSKKIWNHWGREKERRWESREGKEREKELQIRQVFQSRNLLSLVK